MRHPKLTWNVRLERRRATLLQLLGLQIHSAQLYSGVTEPHKARHQAAEGTLTAQQFQSGLLSTYSTNWQLVKSAASDVICHFNQCKWRSAPAKKGEAATGQCCTLIANEKEGGEIKDLLLSELSKFCQPGCQIRDDHRCNQITVHIYTL